MTQTKPITKLKALRLKTGKSTAAVCRELYKQAGWEVHNSSLTRWESGYPMKIDAARILAGYYGVTMEDIA